jgi:hypothetical protein
MVNLRLTEEEQSVLKHIAKNKNQKVSALVRESCFAQLHNLGEHDKLLGSLKPEDPEETQKTFFDVLNKSSDSILKSLEKLHLDILEEFKFLEKLQRKGIYLQFYLTRETPQEEHAQRAKYAVRQTSEYLEEIDEGNHE